LEGQNKRKNLVSLLTRIKRINDELYKVLKSCIPKPIQSEKNVELIKLLFLMTKKIFDTMVDVNVLVKVPANFAIEELYLGIISEDELLDAKSDLESFGYFFKRRKI
jgi:hypothetical protein